MLVIGDGDGEDKDNNEHKKIRKTAVAQQACSCCVSDETTYKKRRKWHCRCLQKYANEKNGGIGPQLPDL